MKGLKVQDQNLVLKKEDVEAVLKDYIKNNFGMSFKSFFESKTGVLIEEIKDFDFSILGKMEHLDFSGINFIGCKFGLIIESKFNGCQFFKSQFLSDVSFCNFEEVSFVGCDEAYGIKKIGNIFSYSNPFFKHSSGKFNSILEGGNLVHISSKLEDVDMHDKDLLHLSLKSRYKNLDSEALRIVEEAKGLGLKIPNIEADSMVWVSTKGKTYASKVLADVVEAIEAQKLVNQKTDILKNHEADLKKIDSDINILRQEQIKRFKIAGVLNCVVGGVNIFFYKFPLDQLLPFLKNQKQVFGLLENFKTSTKLKLGFAAFEILLMGIITLAYVSKNSHHREMLSSKGFVQEDIARTKSQISYYNTQKSSKSFVNDNTFVEIENSKRTKIDRSCILGAIARNL